VGKGFFPLDEELELLPGELTPSGHESLVRLCGWMPFRQASETIRDLLGIRVNKNISQQYTENAGSAYEQIQNEEVDELEKKASLAPQGAEKMQISVDGCMIPLLHGVWAEVKTLVVGEVEAPIEEHGVQVVHTRKLSYFSRKVSAETFIRLAQVEIHRRGIENAREVATVMDGAEWEQGFADHHCPLAIRFLDFPHAAEHISVIGSCLYGENTPETAAWLEKRLHTLKHSGPDELLTEIHDLQIKFPEKKEVVNNLAYLEKRRKQIQYPQFQVQGWPIGSGMVESGNKLVVEFRLKGAGMHWAEKNANPMLAIRNILCNDRWKEEWPKIESRLRKQNYQKRQKMHQDHAYTAHLLNWQPLDLPKPVVLKHPPNKSKPNPWRNFKLNRALYKQSVPPIK
jgi:hypothetical protein